MVELGGFVLLPAIIFGIIIGFIELVFVHADERGMGWLSHGLHALPFTFIFVFLTMNIPWALSFVNIPGGIWVEVGVIVLVGIIGMVKIAAAAAIAGKVGEKKIHVLIIGILIMAAPFLWTYLLADIVGPLLPFN